MSSTSHLQRRHSELEKQYDVLSEKIERLRVARARSARVKDDFELEGDIEQAEAEHDNIVRQFEALESELGRSPPKKVKEA
ncbi:MAG: hypothetical protein GY832_17050 [Chloroflexi bacterium]|nr:hypothetical protein [Chloroflexota bacterium]